ncbi:MAG: ribokinase [Ruminococcus sp.]|nr:ribokinase [Ruminococcus sp.]
MKKPKILVVGSMNMDLFVEGANTIPKFGESILCGNYGYATGGKGSNQAIAAALQGADVTMVGRLGDDTNGESLRKELKKAGVHTEYIVTDPDRQTGLALMLLHEDGRYVSYVALGANGGICGSDVKAALDACQFDMVIMQLEMPLETVYQTYELAKERKIPVFLDAGPAMNIPLKRLEGLFILSPNEAETEALTGINPDTEEKAIQAAKMLYEEAKPEYVILKLGSRGAMLYDGNNIELIPCFKVKAVDSTAAGDTFGAALAIRLCKGDNMRDAIRFAHAAAGICVSRMGAQVSIPREEEVAEFLSQFSQVNS